MSAVSSVSAWSNSRGCNRANSSMSGWLRSLVFHHPEFARRDIEGCQSPALTASGVRSTRATAARKLDSPGSRNSVSTSVPGV